MKYLLPLFCAIAAPAAVAQTTWTYTAAPTTNITRITDVVEHDGSYTILRNEYDLQATPRSRSSLLALDGNGASQQIRDLWNSSTSFYAYSMLRNDGPPGVVVHGTIDEQPSGVSFIHLAADHTLQVLDSNEIRLPGLVKAYVHNVAALPNGAGSAATIMGYRSLEGPVNGYMLLRVSATGDSLHSFEATAPYPLIPRDIVLVSPDTLLVSNIGMLVSPLPVEGSPASYTKFSDELNLLSGFISRPFNGTSDPITWFNTLFDFHLVRLSSGNLIASGRPESAGYMRTVVLKLGPSGEWKAVFMPQSGFPADCPGHLESLALEGDMLWVASMENFHPGTPQNNDIFTPDHPNQVRIFKLDTALNVVCTQVLDGFADSTYYWVDRIKATTDGGYLLCGARVDLHVPNARMVGWVQKFGPDDCFTSMEEGSLDVAINVFPNPGTDQLHIQLNGPIRSGRLSLWDMNGREVSHATLYGNAATIDTQALNVGVYAYRVSSTQGELLSSGRWVKVE